MQKTHRRPVRQFSHFAAVDGGALPVRLWASTLNISSRLTDAFKDLEDRRQGPRTHSYSCPAFLRQM